MVQPSSDASRFNVVLVGAGEQAWESRGPSIQALADEGVALVALASPTAARRSAVAERLGLARSYASLTEALAHERVDGVVITAPNALHESLTLEALAAGCHVLCEKPMALDAAGGRRMVEAAERADRVLTIGYQYPWTQPGLVELVDAGELDTTFRVEAHWTRANGIPPQRAFWDHPSGGAAGDLLGHLLSIARLGIPGRPRWVTAFAWNRFGQHAHGADFAGHDTLEALVSFEQERTVHALVAWAINHAAEESIGVAFHGTDTSVEVPLMGRERDVERFRPIVHRRVDGTVTRQPHPGPAPVQTEQAFVLQARDWVDACRGRDGLRLRSSDALDIQAILDAALASAAQSGRPVDIQT